MILKFLFLFLFFFFVIGQDPTTWRPIDGFNHNPYQPLWGNANIQLQRKGPAVYGDGISSPRTATFSGNPLPSPRLVSDNVFKNPGTIPLNRRGLTDFVTYWGQFIDHDFTLSSGDPNGFAAGNPHLDIPVPKGDSYFDPHSFGNVTLPFVRGVFDPATGTTVDTPWTPMTLVTGWMDGSQIYGSDNATAFALRAFSNGLLKSFFIGSEEYPPLNTNTSGVVMQTAGIANQNQLFMLGDVRGNENPGLTALHVLFLREHNRRARQLLSENPTWTDEELYQESRKFVIAIIDHITEEEYLPVTLGEHFEEYQTFEYDLSPDVFADFSTGGFRYGHSEVNSAFELLDSNNNPIPGKTLPLMSSYFNPMGSILTYGIDPILRGMAQTTQGAVDVVFVDALRNYLFGQPGTGAGVLDLTAINIQRGRDHGLPGFNMFRDNYNLAPYTQWSQINPDPNVWQSLANSYESIDDCDIYVCGLAELPYNTLSNVGETFHAVIREQYHKLRDSDPFWYEADGYLTDAEESEVRQTTLAELISRNTNISKTGIQCLPMALPDGCGLPTGPLTPPGPYDFIVTLGVTSPSNPLFGLENDLSFSIDGINGAVIYLTRGRNYTFWAQTSCSHAFFIATTPDVGNPPFATPYANVINPYSCLQQNSLLTLIVDNTTPSQLFYTCGLHLFMGGNISIVEALPSGSSGSIVIPSSIQTYPTSKALPLPSRTAATPIVSNNGPNQSNAGTIAAAVLVPILFIIIVILSVILYLSKRKKSYTMNVDESSRRGSKVELDARG